MSVQETPSPSAPDFVHNFAATPKPPYYAVIFSNQIDSMPEGYAETADLMVRLAQDSPGFLGIESTRNAEGFGITVSYWKDETSIATWKRQADHQHAQEKGHTTWYSHFELRVAHVDRAYSGPTHQGPEADI